jgi:hypothetical protein
MFPDTYGKGSFVSMYSGYTVAYVNNAALQGGSCQCSCKTEIIDALRNQQQLLSSFGNNG